MTKEYTRHDIKADNDKKTQTTTKEYKTINTYNNKKG